MGWGGGSGWRGRREGGVRRRRGGWILLGGVLGGEMENKSCLWRIENVWIRRSRKSEDIILYTTRSLDYFNNIGAGIGINLLYSKDFPAAS